MKKYITLRANRPVDVNNKCAQCANSCKQHKNLLIVLCPHFTSSKKHTPHPSVGEGVKNSPLESLNPSVCVVGPNRQEGRLIANKSAMSEAEVLRERA